MTYDNLCDSEQTEQCHEAQRVVLFFRLIKPAEWKGLDRLGN